VVTAVRDRLRASLPSHIWNCWPDAMVVDIPNEL
jgi:hypothetical protein